MRDTITSPTADSPGFFSPGMVERDLQTEKLMEEMGQLRAALAAVTGSVSSHTASVSGEALLPDLPAAWSGEEQLGEDAEGEEMCEPDAFTQVVRAHNPMQVRT